MDLLSQIKDLLICVDCKVGGLEVAADRQEIVCRNCGKRFRIVNSVPGFVTEELFGFSEVAAEKQTAFLEAKKIAYSGKSPVSSMYNHYHQYAAAVRLENGTIPRTLDIGFGIGEHYPHVTQAERQHCSFIGVDLDRFKLEYFSSLHPELPVLQANVFSLPFSDNCMDVVQILATLEHFPQVEVERLLDEAVRTLRPGGVLITCYPAEGGFMLRACQILMHALIRLRTGFDLENETMHHHQSTAVSIRNILGKRADLQRVDSRFYPFDFSCVDLALFVNETYRKIEER
jgi:SAM-dependent methyltransferase/uncharacterized protein YbaR (Trm112 family)